MDRRQKLILLISFLTFLGAVAAAAYLSSQKQSTGLDTSKRFTAKPGTTRENAVALSSSKRPSTEGKAAQSEPPADGRALPVRSLSGTEEILASAESVIADKALGMSSPDQGLLLVEQALAEANTDEERAILEAARAVLLSRMADDDNWTAAQAAFERAATAAAALQPTREWVVEQHAQALIQRGLLLEAATLLQEALSAPVEQLASTMRLKIFLGSVYELQDQPALARETYEQAVDWLLRMEPWNEETADLTRLASLRLARIYREVGDDVQAKKLARRVQARLMPDTPEP